MARAIMNIEIAVEYEEVRRGEHADGVYVHSVGVGELPRCPLPPDAPAPRRLKQNIASAVAAQLKAERAPVPPEPK